MPPIGETPRLEPAEPVIDAHNLSKIESVPLTDAQMDSLKAARPEWFGKDPKERFRGSKFRFTDKDGKVTEKVVYEKLGDNEKNKVAETPVVIQADNFEISEETAGQEQDDYIYISSGLKQQPEFPGGIMAFNNAIIKEIKIPDIKDITVRVYVSFVVEKDGTISNIKAVRDPGYGLGDEAVRAIKTITTRWQPGMHQGKPVRTSYAVPIVINTKK